MVLYNGKVTGHQDSGYLLACKEAETQMHLQLVLTGISNTWRGMGEGSLRKHRVDSGVKTTSHL